MRCAQFFFIVLTLMISMGQLRAELLSSRPAYRTALDLVGAESYELHYRAEAWWTQGFFDEEGTATQLQQGSFSFYDHSLLMDYGYNEVLQLRVGGTLRHLQSSSEAAGLVHDESLLQLHSALLEASLVPSQDGGRAYQFGFTGRYRQVLYSVTEYASLADVPATELALGHGESAFTALAHAQWRFTPQWLLDGSFGLRFFSSDRSQELPYRLQLIWRQPGHALRAGVRGFFSANNDSFDSNRAAKPVVGVNNTRRFNSVNEVIHKPFIGGSLRLWGLDWGVELATTAQGRSSDQGLEGILQISWRASEKPTPEQELVGRFKEYELEGQVLLVSKEQRFIKIDRGANHSVANGQIFDIFEGDYEGNNRLIASGRVVKVAAQSSIVKVLKKIRPVPLKAGQVARGRLR